MTDNVEPLFGDAGRRMDKPDPHCIACLEDALERARSGHLQGVVIATLDCTGMARYDMAGETNSWNLIGGLDVAKAQLAAEAGEFEEVDPL